MSQLLISTPRSARSRRKPSPKGLREESGQSLIELALVLPLFFALMIAFINFCMVMFGACNLSYACRQADRYACLHSSTSLLPMSQATIDAQVAPYVFRYPSNSYTDKLSNGSNAVGGTATVTVTITYNIALPFMSIPAFTLSSTASGAIVQ